MVIKRNGGENHQHQQRIKGRGLKKTDCKLTANGERVS